MLIGKCLFGICFEPLQPGAPKLFGFSEFIAGLALMVLVWTIADVRYRFRVRTTPLPLQGLTFSIVAALGLLTLLTDLWRAEGWLVPEGRPFTPASWQACLAGLYLFTFLAWAWFAFIRPPRYGAGNAQRFAHTIYGYILRGVPLELAVVADELAGSAKALVLNAPEKSPEGIGRIGPENEPRPPLSDVMAYANDILLLIADKRFCRVVVESSPIIALSLFQETREHEKFGINISTFAKNVVNQAIINRNSFLYQEAEGYESGLIGYQKPLSRTMFGNWEMVESVGSMLDPDLEAKWDWNAPEWEVYCRLFLIMFEDYVQRGFSRHSFVLYRAIGYIENAPSDLYKLNGSSVEWRDDSYQRLRVVVDFFKDAVKILDRKGVANVRLRIREQRRHLYDTFYDYLANSIFDVVFHASAVKSPQSECWTVQHNSLWSELFNFGHLDGPAGKIIKLKVRRLLYDEISQMSRFPNFKGANILGFCLNVMGLRLPPGNNDRDSRALQKSILAWTKSHYAWLREQNPRVAEACLVDGITYDAENHRLIKTYAQGLEREPQRVYLEVDPAPEQ